MELSLRIFVIAFVGGLIGTVAMDVVKYVGHRLRLIGGVRMDVLGRWALGMLGGRFVHDDIHESSAIPGEVAAGWIFHYLTGGLVALAYPLLVLIPGSPLPIVSLESAILFGLATSVLPWFIVYPAFGKGWFGSKAPKAARPILTSVVSHTFYGLGVGIAFVAPLSAAFGVS